jgi:GMP synthase (glutamine-hydrolysing)
VPTDRDAVGLADPPELAALRVVVVQIRDDARVERQERDCFVELSGLDAEQFDWWNVVARPEISWRDLAGYDAIVIGGAGAHSVTETYPFTAPLERAVDRLAADRRPIFGSCWGHQFLAEALGGEVITDLERKELGTFTIELTDAGRRDPWLEGLPPRFGVQLGHHDRVTRLPGNAVELAYSELCRNQAFRLADAPIYGAQFHVELDKPRMIARAEVYRDAYLSDPGALDRLVAALEPTPEAATLFRRFLERVVAPGA